MAGVNLYALFQLRQLTALSTEMASYHYPAVEAAKRLQGSLFAQLNSEKKYLATNINLLVIEKIMTIEKIVK